jgi:hypothetical protein
MIVAALIAAAPDSWFALVVAALGSSAVGAVVGGLLTTWVRGRFEREEAWRTRLIEAADGLSAATAGALLLGGELVWEYEQPASALRDKTGKLTQSGIARISEVRRANNDARVLLTRVQLLFGGGSATYASANESLSKLRELLALLEGRAEQLSGLDIVTPASIGERAKTLHLAAAEAQIAFAHEASTAVRRRQKPHRRRGEKRRAPST